MGFTTRNERLSLWVPDEAVKSVDTKLEGVGVDTGRPLIVVHPGASDPKRQYPPALYAQAIPTIVREMAYQVVITGVAAEASVSNTVMKGRGQGVFSLVGQVDMGELAALIVRAKLLISNNTGPVHIAAAVQTPVVDLYARTNPEHTPWQVRSRVLYFDVPEHLHSRTPALVYTTPRVVKPMPTPADIVCAVRELLADKGQQCSIAEEVTSWE